MISVPALIFLVCLAIAIWAMCWACRWSDPDFMRIKSPESGRTYLILRADAAQVRGQIDEELSKPIAECGTG